MGFFLSQSIAAPPGYYGMPGNYGPQPPYIPQPQYIPQTNYLPPPPPNNFLYPPPHHQPMSMSDMSYQLSNTVNRPLPPLPPIGPHDIGKPMPAEAAAAVHAPASSYGNGQAEYEMEAGGSAASDVYNSPQSSLLDSYYNGRPSSSGPNDVMGVLATEDLDIITRYHPS
ncbi:hypothetical protein Btru_027453 [Bulinus truncatus]|nr:hypothetical protein Btru_027453 [Bulinus truncatus]